MQDARVGCAGLKFADWFSSLLDENQKKVVFFRRRLELSGSIESHSTVRGGWALTLQLPWLSRVCVHNKPRPALPIMMINAQPNPLVRSREESHLQTTPPRDDKKKALALHARDPTAGSAARKGLSYDTACPAAPLPSAGVAAVPPPSAGVEVPHASLYDFQSEPRLGGWRDGITGMIVSDPTIEEGVGSSSAADVQPPTTAPTSHPASQPALQLKREMGTVLFPGLSKKSGEWKMNECTLVSLEPASALVALLDDAFEPLTTYGTIGPALEEVAAAMIG